MGTCRNPWGQDVPCFDNDPKKYLTPDEFQGGECRNPYGLSVPCYPQASPELAPNTYEGWLGDYLIGPWMTATYVQYEYRPEGCTLQDCDAGGTGNARDCWFNNGALPTGTCSNIVGFTNFYSSPGEVIDAHFAAFGSYPSRIWHCCYSLGTPGDLQCSHTIANIDVYWEAV